jgi:hypothetical protein
LLLSKVLKAFIQKNMQLATLARPLEIACAFVLWYCLGGPIFSWERSSMAANPMTSAPLFFFRNFHKKCDGSCTCDVLQTGVGRSTYGVSH